MVKEKELYGTGLDKSAVAVSRRKYGTNKLSRQKSKGFWGQFTVNLGDPVIKVLLVALAVNIIFTFRHLDWLETTGIALAILMATMISTLSEYNSQSAFKKLSEEERPTVTVRRNGEIEMISTDELVVGDTVLLSAGEKISADGILISGSVFVDQSAMTGESAEVQKTALSLSSLPYKYENGDFIFENPAKKDFSPASKNAVFRGCLISSGEGEMIVCAGGDSSFLGEIFSEVQLDTRESPLKLRLSKLASQISRLGYAAAFLVALASLFSSLILQSDFSREVIISKIGDPSIIFPELLHALTLGLTVVIMAVPEGLPMMIAVILSSNIKKMVRDNVLVRKPVGIEAAGSMNILFTDKTGTLTKGILSVEEFVLPDGTLLKSANELRKKEGKIYEAFCLSSLCNTAAKLSHGKIIGGNATERALLECVKNQKTDARIISKMPFDSSKKYSSATINGKTLFKGAPEILLPHIRYAASQNGKAPFARYTFEAKISELMKDGKRVLLIAEGERGTLSELTLICAVTLHDSLRKEAKDSVRTLKNAGISVVMITGDSIDTAKSIAEGCSILDKRSDICVTASELAKMSDSQISKILPRLAVVARALPSDKSRLVRIAQEKNLVVGMTGDGINDAPALRRADIGFSMGNGTQVAKEAGDIIILDNNLASIVKAVLYGRNIFKSIRKFLVFQLTMNFASVGVSMIAPFFGFDTPITVVQMLWVNMIMDTLGGLAFAGEAAHKRCMRERPKRREEPILNGYMMHQIIISGSFTILISMLFLKHPFFVSHFRESADNIVLLGAFFALFIFLGVMQCFNSRTDRLNLFSGISKNPAFIFIMCAIAAIQISFVYLGGAMLRTTPLAKNELLFTLVCASLSIIVEFIRKIIWRFSGKTTGF